MRVQDLGLPEAADPDLDAAGRVPRTNAELMRLKKEVRRAAVSEVEKNFLMHALEKSNWNITRAAKDTGLQRTNFQGLMKKHGIRARKPAAPPQSPADTKPD